MKSQRSAKNFMLWIFFEYDNKFNAKYNDVLIFRNIDSDQNND